MKTLNFTILILLVAGALFMGINAVFGRDTLSFIFGSLLEKIFYFAVGIAGVVGVGAIVMGKRSL